MLVIRIEPNLSKSVKQLNKFWLFYIVIIEIINHWRNEGKVQKLQNFAMSMKTQVSIRSAVTSKT